MLAAYLKAHFSPCLGSLDGIMRDICKTGGKPRPSRFLFIRVFIYIRVNNNDWKLNASVVGLRITRHVHTERRSCDYYNVLCNSVLRARMSVYKHADSIRVSSIFDCSFGRVQCCMANLSKFPTSKAIQVWEFIRRPKQIY